MESNAYWYSKCIWFQIYIRLVVIYCRNPIVHHHVIWHKEYRYSESEHHAHLLARPYVKMVKTCNASTGSEKGEEMSSFTGTTISTIYQYTILHGHQAHFLAPPHQYFDYYIIINSIMYTTHATLIICVFCNHSIVFLLYVEP